MEKPEKDTTSIFECQLAYIECMNASEEFLSLLFKISEDLVDKLEDEPGKLLPSLSACILPFVLRLSVAVERGVEGLQTSYDHIIPLHMKLLSSSDETPDTVLTQRQFKVGTPLLFRIQFYLLA